MADIVDVAQGTSDFLLEASIKGLKQNRKLTKNGLCHNCQEHISAAHLFCDADCSSDYEKREENQRRA